MAQSQRKHHEARRKCLLSQASPQDSQDDPQDDPQDAKDLALAEVATYAATSLGLLSGNKDKVVTTVTTPKSNDDGDKKMPGCSGYTGAT